MKLSSLIALLLVSCSTPPVEPTPPDLGPDAPDSSTIDASPADASSGDSAVVRDASDLGARPDLGGEFVGSYVRASCGPSDGPAFQLELFDRMVRVCEVDTASRTVGFYVHDLGGATIPPTAGSRLESTPDTAHGTANRGDGASTETWTLTFESYEAGVGARGTYFVTWEDGSTSSGQFDASWCGEPMLCG